MTNVVEEMKAEDKLARMRRDAVKQQIGMINECISDAEVHRNDFDPKIYHGIISGYNCIKDHLIAEEAKWFFNLLANRLVSDDIVDEQGRSV